MIAEIYSPQITKHFHFHLFGFDLVSDLYLLCASASTAMPHGARVQY